MRDSPPRFILPGNPFLLEPVFPANCGIPTIPTVELVMLRLDFLDSRGVARFLKSGFVVGFD